jgi:uncharacterized DUF497 family protein
VFNRTGSTTIASKISGLGGRRVISYGHLQGQLVCVVRTPRGKARHVIYMRYANGREKKRFEKRSREG